jgi:PAS domain S-box-containing protein
MDRLQVSPFTRRVLAVSLAVGSALVGTAVLEIVLHVTGQFVTAVLVLPVIVTTWYAGLLAGVLTIAVQTVFAVLALPAVPSFTVASREEAIRLAVAVCVSVIAMVIVASLRAVERRFRAVVTLASEGIWTIDADGRTTYVNPRMAEMLGYTPAAMKGRRFSEFVPPDDVQPAEQNFEQRKRGVSQRAECVLVRKDGTTFIAYYAGTPLSDGSRITGALAVVTDITERKRDEEIIRQQGEALVRANRQKEDFLAMLGHEMRNPLTPIITALTLMELKGDESFSRERAIIRRQAEQLTRLVEDISDVSRFMRGKLNVRREAVDVARVVREAHEVVSPLLESKHHTLHVDVPDGLVIEADSVRLRQVVVNLLTNATKYTPSGGRIVVTGEADGGHVVLRVQDNGTGIAPEFLPLLFEPFTQTPRASDGSEGGLGLGLAIVQGIVHAHGGAIEARSDGPGQGSEFVVRLPVTCPDGVALD